MKNPNISGPRSLPTLSQLPPEQRIKLEEVLKKAGFEAIDLDAISTQATQTSKGLDNVVALGVRSIGNKYYGSEEPLTSGLVAARMPSPEQIISSQQGAPNVTTSVSQALAGLPVEVRGDKALMQQLASALLDLAKTT